jgi:hypothetical protein
MRVVQLTERGRVKKRRTFKRGDEVTKSDLHHIEGRFEALVASGALVDEDDLPDEESPFVDDAGLAKGPATDNSHEDSGAASADPGYEDWDYDVLKATLAERNADRPDDEQIEPLSNSKANIAAALKADDEAQANVD